MPLYRRVPKRGFKPLNKVEYQVVNLSAIAETDGTELGPEELKAGGLISSLRKPVKILGVGAPGRAVTVRAHAFSATTKEKLEAEGGRAELIG
jgi:large subunit ribosomal protein L15